ncbi:MAG: hypothetical protein EOO16_05560 [Chitinophagaceae bacterium]|nr:MAG: hypothetical protein EOO16_05560 [Chitinophagaceae bacterium]
MKKLTQTLLGIFLAATASVEAQQVKTIPVELLAPTHTQKKRCQTMEGIEVARRRDPLAFEAEIAARRSRARFNTARVTALTAPVTIPVVVHVVLTNPSIITDAQVDALIARLNLDFSGLNPDSTNAGAFLPLRGHSMIRFARARRTPSGQLTSGIERRVGVTQIGLDTYQDIKHTSQGGLDPWDVEKYYNIWVGVGESGLLGIAPAIGRGNATETPTSGIGIDGVCIDYSVFSNGCFSDPDFNLGRTVVHEIGHNFGLYHIFSGCNPGDDFQDSEDGLPQTLNGSADDTPSQSVETSGCLTGVVASNCTGVSSKMYQNYMDYTNDACYSMFTKGQVKRMEYTLEIYRPGYLTTQGHLPPATLPGLDVAPSLVLSPGGVEFNNSTCSITSYGVPFCAGNITPRIEVTNRGTTTITSITVKVQLNGGTPTSTTINGLNIPTSGTANVTLPVVALPAGNNVVKYITSAPNGGADAVATNDTLTQTINLAAPIAGPITADFESTSFPPANFVIDNPGGDTTWRRAGTGRSSTGSLFINNYDNENIGSIDDFRSNSIALAPGADSLVVSFDVAHKAYNTQLSDTLQVLVTPNCGVSYTSIFKKWGSSTLATAGTTTASYLNPAAGDWRSERVAILASSLNSNTVNVLFRDKNRYGNNIFVDNINIRSTCKTTSVSTQPLASTVCAGTAASFSVAATGNASLTYQWQQNGSNIAGATSNTYSIASAAASNAGNYTVVITNACGVATTSSAAALTVNTGGSCSGSAVANINPDIEAVVLMPNLVRSNTTVRVKAQRAMKIDWTVVDGEGRIVKRFTQSVSAGTNDLKINVQELAAGSYQLVGNSAKGKTSTIRFVRL